MSTGQRVAYAVDMLRCRRNQAPARSLTPVMKRRAMLIGGTAMAGASILTGARVDRRSEIVAGPGPGETLTRMRSAARGKVVDFYVGVPEKAGDGRGLPVCLVLHGGSKTAVDFPGLGLQRQLNAAVARGVPAFVLAGATGDRLAWRPSGRDDPQRMVREEIPAWCAARGFDTSRLAVWGWSMGGYGSLLLAETFPGLVRAVAAFSPAVSPGDDVFAGAGKLGALPVGLWCGRQDPLYGTVRELERALPQPPVAGGYADGRHNFSYWSTAIPAAFDFIGRNLAAR